MKILVTGSAGFIAGYLIEELLAHGHTVVGIDNFSKYGPVQKSYDTHERYQFTEGDVLDRALLFQLAEGCEQIIAAAAMVGGIAYFHRYAYDLLANNDRIIANTSDAAIHHFQKGNLKRLVVLSSSMVFENATRFPTPEQHLAACPPPDSAYGFQKLAVEHYARAAFSQYALPYTILRPFNCVGIGEQRALLDPEMEAGNVSLAMSHVVPDFCRKALLKLDPFPVFGDGKQVRHYTYGADLAEGIRMAVESDVAINQDYNLSTAKATTVAELARVIWNKINPDCPLNLHEEKPFLHDVARRSPDVQKAKAALGFEATTPLDTMLDEVIPWVKAAMKQGVV